MKISQRLQSRSQALNGVRLPPKYVPTLEWGPDYSPLNTQGLYRCLNAVPIPNGIGPMPKLVEQTNALDSKCLGGLAVDDGQGTWVFFAGDKNKLYVGVTGTFTDASRPAGYTVADDDNWRFLDWGDKILATNISDPLQAATSNAAGVFEDAITDTRKPQAKYMAEIAQRVVLANTSDALDGQQPRRIWWSALGDYTKFDPDAATGANYIPRKDGGTLTGITGGKEFGLAFQTKKVLRIDAAGGAQVYAIEPIDNERGCPYPNTIIPYGRFVFFVSEGGVYYNDGSDSTNISYGKVQRQFWKIFDTNRPDDMSATIDRRNNLLVLAIPQESAIAKRLFTYNMIDGRWTESEQDIDTLIEFRKPGYTLEGMDADYPSIDDDVPYSLDDDFWKGGRLETGAFTSAHALATFTGANQPATIVTNLITGSDGGSGVTDKSSINRVWPLIHGEQTASVRLIRRNSLYLDDTVGQTPLVGPFVPMRRGRTRFNTKNEARYHQIELFVPEGAQWDMIEGMQVEMSRIGGRIG